MDVSFEKGLREILQSSTHYTTQIGEYILNSGGKRLRPKLVTIIGKAIGLSEEAVMPIAYTVELMHTASLLHDDVVDCTEMRRSRPTANQVYGDKPALLAGDFITASAMELVCGFKSTSLIKGLIQTVKRMAEGELKELQHAREFHDDMDVYLDIIYLKTATLFEYCTYAPGILAGLKEEALQGLKTFGRAVGMGFQIVDDIINLTPSKDDDKDPYNDILEGKSTLPLVLIFQEDPKVLSDVSGILDPEERKSFLVPFITPRILNKSREIARKYLQEAIDALGQAGIDSPELRKIPEVIAAQLDSRF